MARTSYNEFFRSADVVLLPHNDVAGRTHAEKVAAALHANAARVRVVDIAALWPQCPEKGDVSDWIVAGGTTEKLQELINATHDWSPYPTRLRPLDLKKFLQLAIKSRGMVIEPIIPEKGLAMLYAARGTGKTHIALGIGFAVATGTKFLKWSAPKPRRVLLIDGEMPAAALQERLASIIAGSPGAELNSENIMILAGDLIEAGGIGNLAAPEVQSELDPWLDGIEFLILDNLSSLTAVIRDNDAESWGPISRMAPQIAPSRYLSADRPPCGQGRPATRHKPTGRRAGHKYFLAATSRLLAHRRRKIRGSSGKDTRIFWGSRETVRGQA